MKIIHHNELYQLTFMPRIFPVNCYFTKYGKELILIDTGLPYSANAILKAADDIGLPIAHIVLTHAHHDHIGALDELKRQLPHAIVYISERDEKILKGDVALLPDEGEMPIKGGVPKPGAIKTKADILLSAGKQIGPLTAIDTPGHTPGSMSFYNEQTGTLLTGDALQTRGGLTVSGQWNIWFPFPAMATWNKEKAIHSAQMIEQLKPNVIAAGHGNLLYNPQSALNKAIEKVNKKVNTQY